MSDPDTSTPRADRPGLNRFGRRGTFILGAGLLAAGIVAGAGVVAETRPSVTMAPAVPVAIRALSSSGSSGGMSSGGIVTVRGQVAEVYGNKFILADASGRALVDTGREGDERRLVTAGEPVTVQGRFERGFVHAAFLVGADRKVVALGPLAGPPHGPHGPDRGPGGPHGGPDGPPPPAADRAGPPPGGGGTSPSPASQPPADAPIPAAR